MKQFFLPLLGALLFVGCNKESVEVSEISSTQQLAPISLELSLEGTAMSADELRSVSFDTNRDIPPTKHEAGVSNWQTHCFLRNESGTEQAYALIDWDARVEGGKVKLKMKGHTLNLQQSGSRPLVHPRPGEYWYITGIAGGGKLNADRTQISFAPEAADQNLNPNQARVPFAFPWTGFTVSRAQGEEAPKISVHLKPVGSLLHFRLNNQRNVHKRAIQGTLQVISNALSADGYFDFSLSNPRRVNAATAWKFTNTAVREETLERRIKVAKDDVSRYVVWGMPRSESEEPISGFKTEVRLPFHQLLQGGTEDLLLAREGAFRSGLAYPLGIDVNEPFIPLEYVAPRNVAPDGVSFATSDRNDASGYFNWNDAVNKFKDGIEIEGKRYHLPSVNEWTMIYPSRGCKFRGSSDGETTISNVPEVMPVNNASITYYTDYYSPQDGNVYAVKFKGGDQQRVVIYRYRPVGTFSDGNVNSHIEITSRYVGTSLGNIDRIIDKIKNVAFWETNTTSDFKLLLPASGVSSNSVIHQRGLISGYWTTDEKTDNATLSLNAGHSPNSLGLGGYNPKAHGLSVRLFRHLD